MKTAQSFARTLAMTTTSPIHSVGITRVTAGAAVLIIGACLCSAGATDERDTMLKQRLIGTWTTKAFGTQELTNFSDGTARLDVTLNRLGALRYGKSLTLDLVWTVQNGVMTHTVQGGTPPAKVDRLVRDWGKTLEYEIVEVTDTHMLLEKPDDDDQTRWDAKSELARN
jgi:hypothetical protein